MRPAGPVPPGGRRRGGLPVATVTADRPPEPGSATVTVTAGGSEVGATGARRSSGPETSPRRPGGEAGRGEGGRGEARTGPEGRAAASFALGVFMICSAAGLVRVFQGHRWVIPVVVSVTVVELVCWATRKRRLPLGIAAPLVAIAAGLVVAWTVFGATTFAGVPTPSTWHDAFVAWNGLGHDFSSTVPPVGLTKGFELLAVGGAGIATALSDWIGFRLRVATAAVLPGLGVFVYCAAASVAAHRGAVVAVEVAGASLYLLVERASAGRSGAGLAGTRPPLDTAATAAGVVIAAVAVTAAAALSPALPRDGSGLLGFRTGVGAGGGERIVPNPLVSLQTDLTRFADVPVFEVASAVPSYWRLTSLDVFDGTTWTSTGSYSGFGSKLPGGLAVPPGTRTVSASFFIQNLDSPWLPAQFTPYALKGAKHVTYDPASDSLLGAANTANGLSYTVSAYQFLDTLSAADLEAAPPVGPDSADAGDLELPQSIDPRVVALAQTITTGQSSEYAKALAIQDYLRGPQFSYSLDPKSDGSGNTALDTFLFQTRQGYCQQFAGAYAVLARAAGLPTRLAVGFVTGQSVGGQFHVYDADAHTWPEVYFGPRYGWVPFEPTPGFSIPGTSSYTDLTASSIAPGGTASPTTTPPSTLTSPPSSSGGGHNRLLTTTLPPTSVHPAGSSGPGSSWWLALPAVVLFWLTANGFGPVLTRRWRRRRAAAEGAGAVVANEWAEVSRELGYFGLRRHQHETVDEFARRCTTGLERMAIVPAGAAWQHGGVGTLAGLVRRSVYAPSLPDEAVAVAVAAADEIRRRLLAGLPTKERLRRWSAPPPGLWSALVARLGRRGG